MRSDVPLLERDHELAVVDGLVEAACAGAGAALVIEGPAGIGKTRLLAAACRSAAERQVTVLRARGGELEQGTPYGLVRELFAGPLAQAGRDELLSGAAALAAPVVAGSEELALTTAAGAGPHGLYWLTVNLADRTPVVLAVDDVQWADEASLRFLGYLASGAQRRGRDRARNAGIAVDEEELLLDTHGTGRHTESIACYAGIRGVSASRRVAGTCSATTSHRSGPASCTRAGAAVGRAGRPGSYVRDICRGVTAAAWLSVTR